MKTALYLILWLFITAYFSFAINEPVKEPAMIIPSALSLLSISFILYTHCTKDKDLQTKD